jgi:sec-independent protein translocase protein TatC
MTAEAKEPGTPEVPEADVKMTIWEHLNELRSRLVRAAIGVLVTTCVAWAYRVQILAWLIHPYEKAWIARKMPGVPELQTLSPGDVFIGYLQLSLVAGIIAAAPIIFYQLWAFVSPGLSSREKKFAYYVAFPFTFNYFFSLLGQVSDSGTVLTQRPTLEFYLDFSTRMLLAFGIVFELPLFITFLSLAGIVTPMQLLRFGRWAVLLSFVVGAIATPGPEITSQIAVSGALVVLYFLSVAIAFLIARNKKKAEKAEKKKD